MLGFVVKHFRSVSHSFTGAQQASRVAMGSELFRDLCSIKHRGSQFVMTLNESWFDLRPDQEQLWLWPEEEPPERPVRIA
jgi:hypothetical protein